MADEEGIRISDAALALITRAAEGSVRDALSLFDQVLAFTGNEVKDDEVAGLLGLVDRELLFRASRAIVEGDSLALLELVESLADYGADYRNFVRELLLHLREVLLVKLAPPGSALVASLLPEEHERLQALAAALSEEDLLRTLDLLTRVEGELRSAPDARVALDLALLKLVQLRRLVPFAELVARVERQGRPCADGAARTGTGRASLRRRGALSPAGQTAAPAAPPAPPTARLQEAQAHATGRPAVTPPPHGRRHPRGDDRRLLGRPSLAAPLRSAQARLEGETLVLEVAADFVRFRAGPRRRVQGPRPGAAGRPLTVRVDVRGADDGGRGAHADRRAGPPAAEAA